MARLLQGLEGDGSGAFSAVLLKALRGGGSSAFIEGMVTPLAAYEYIVKKFDNMGGPVESTPAGAAGPPAQAEAQVAHIQRLRTRAHASMDALWRDVTDAPLAPKPPAVPKKQFTRYIPSTNKGKATSKATARMRSLKHEAIAKANSTVNCMLTTW